MGLLSFHECSPPLHHGPNSSIDSHAGLLVTPFIQLSLIPTLLLCVLS